MAGPGLDGIVHWARAGRCSWPKGRNFVLGVLLLEDSVCARVQVSDCVCVCMCTHAWVCDCVCVHVCMCLSVCSCACAWVCDRVCVCVYMYVHLGMCVVSQVCPPFPFETGSASGLELTNKTRQLMSYRDPLVSASPVCECVGCTPPHLFFSNYKKLTILCVWVFWLCTCLCTM